MKNESIFHSIREYRDYIKGRQTLTTGHETSYADLRYRMRMSYPPFRGERVRRSALFTIGSLVLLALTYCTIAG
jgi:hypothetical protein